MVSWYGSIVTWCAGWGCQVGLRDESRSVEWSDVEGNGVVGTDMLGWKSCVVSRGVVNGDGE